ncbi:hypothetical protein ACQKDB_15965 [Planococcus kocurii]
MTAENREEIIDELTGITRIPRTYFEGLSDERLLQEIDKLRLIY